MFCSPHWLNKRAPDLFITVDAPDPQGQRASGVRSGSSLDKTVPELIRESLDETHFERFLHTREANFAIQRGSLGRFRSAPSGRGYAGHGAAPHRTRIPTFDELVLPPILQEVAMAKRGLVFRRRHWRRQVHHPGGHDRLSQPARWATS